MAIEELLGQLTLEEKCSLLSGSAFWYTQAVERLGIRKLMLTDGGENCPLLFCRKI